MWDIPYAHWIFFWELLEKTIWLGYLVNLVFIFPPTKAYSMNMWFVWLCSSCRILSHCASWHKFYSNRCYFLRETNPRSGQYRCLLWQSFDSNVFPQRESQFLSGEEHRLSRNLHHHWNGDLVALSGQFCRALKNEDYALMTSLHYLTMAFCNMHASNTMVFMFLPWILVFKYLQYKMQTVMADHTKFKGQDPNDQHAKNIVISGAARGIGKSLESSENKSSWQR